MLCPPLLVESFAKLKKNVEVLINSNVCMDVVHVFKNVLSYNICIILSTSTPKYMLVRSSVRNFCVKI
jgi:hypothetical protein